ncbi:ureidoglycolate lyase-like protein [Elsinoe australis]|uniref:Ureidoglycolate lyase-like protein n=1 Tax=Elsinoe australis TaxID=40998 RepID=A0A4U7AS70_9PEZI|nr:ureidoglycolate lyase-like protein [Elsinoe australis]
MASSKQGEVIRIPIEPLTPTSFSQFGTVIENPARDPSSWPSVPESTTANQGTAKKYIDVSHLTNHYSASPSGKPAQPLVSMFVCSPRPLSSSLSPGTTTLPYPGTTKTLRIPVLERHPFTPQTFVPLGLDPSDRATAYIVVVAPTLPSKPPSASRPPPYPTTAPRKPRKRSTLASIFRRARPEPFTNNYLPALISSSSSSSSPRPAPYTAPQSNPNSPSELKEGPTLLPSFSSLVQFRSRPTPLTENLFRPRGTGGPDLSKARAFIAHGGQAVTYGPGTWHAPMAVVGAAEISFVVAQWGNGVAVEDCQEVEVGAGEGGEGQRVLEVVVEEGMFGARTGGGVGGVRAKL